MTRPRLALVYGEPAGIGPELCVRLAQRAQDASLIAIGDPRTLQAAARVLGLPLRLIGEHDDAKPGELALVPAAEPQPVRFGHADPANAGAVIDALLHSGRGCLDGKFDGIVTGPVNKASINAGGIAYTGTTELLAGQADREVVMMLANPTLRVALATTHLPLRAVPDAITRDGLARTLRILHSSLQRDFGIATPRIAVLGLNPHAGDEGLIGSEENTVIKPVINDLKSKGKLIFGPFPADGFFASGQHDKYDGILAMYHDQGLIPFKYIDFQNGVNFTAGLPTVRTSPDHGTAYNIAGRNMADEGSFRQAIFLAADIIKRRMPQLIAQ